MVLGSLFGALVLSISLVGCGSTEVNKDAPDPSAVSNGKVESVFTEEEKRAAEEAGVELDPVAEAVKNDVEDIKVRMTDVDEDWADRKRRDDLTVVEALRAGLTWENADEYHAGRDAFVSSPVGQAASEGVLEDFLPEKYTGGTNMIFAGLDSYVTDISGGRVVYVAIVDVQSKGINDTVATGSFLATYATDESGGIHDFDICSLVG